MEMTVQVEKPTKILRKLTIKVPAQTVARHFEKGLVEVQRSAKLKGFRPGQAPISVIKQFYGEDVRHRVYHNLIDESFGEAVRQHQLKTVGRPRIETPNHKHGEGEHDHGIHEDRDFTYIATIEVLPEIEVKNYMGIPLKRDSVDIKEENVEAAIKNLQESQAELNPVEGGLILPDGTQTSRPVQKGDFVELTFSGGVVIGEGSEGKIEAKPGMKGNRLVEVGSDALVPGFEDQLIGMRRGETKTFRLNFPEDFYEKELSGKETEFTATINEIKEKKLPEVSEDFSKQLGYESVEDLRKKTRDFLLKHRTDEVDKKLKGDLLEALIDKNPFEVPQALVEGQTRALAQDWAASLKEQGLDDSSIQEAVMRELPHLKKRAENQVRASLVLEAIANKENIRMSQEDFDAELKKAAASMKVEEAKLIEFYAKNPDRKEDFEFRMRQDRTLQFLLEKAKIKL